jgi:predicted metalloprotease with PDZ domain
MAVTAVTEGGNAEIAGLQVGDIILEINGKTAGQESSETTARLSPGDAIRLKVRARHGEEHDLKWKMGSREEISYDLKDVDSISSEQRARRAAWLKGEAETPSQMRSN